MCTIERERKPYFRNLFGRGGKGKAGGAEQPPIRVEHVSVVKNTSLLSAFRPERNASIVQPFERWNAMICTSALDKYPRIFVRADPLYVEKWRT